MLDIEVAGAVALERANVCLLCAEHGRRLPRRGESGDSRCGTTRSGFDKLGRR